jgi:hypothetical protein
MKKGMIMKKLTLLFALLCTASALNSMEVQNISDLPEDIHTHIIKIALAPSNDLNEAIKTIKAVMTLRGANYDNPEYFTKLVHALANKFGTTTAGVADAINKYWFIDTPQEYMDAGHALISAATLGDIDAAKEAIIQWGADVNFTTSGDAGPNTALYFAIDKRSPEKTKLEMVKLLLDAGANPNPQSKHPYFKTIFEYLNDQDMPSELKTQIKNLLEDAMKKKKA